MNSKCFGRWHWSSHRRENGVAPTTQITIHQLLYLLMTIINLLPGTTSSTAPMKTETALECNLSTPVSVVAATERFSCQQQETAALLQELLASNPEAQNYPEEEEWEDNVPSGVRRQMNESSSSWDVLEEYLTHRLNETNFKNSRIRNNNHFLLPRILSFAHPENVNQWCFSEIGRLIDALDKERETWALKGRINIIVFVQQSVTLLSSDECFFKQCWTHLEIISRDLCWATITGWARNLSATTWMDENRWK